MQYGTFAGSSKMAAQNESKFFSTEASAVYDDSQKGEGVAGMI